MPSRILKKSNGFVSKFGSRDSAGVSSFSIMFHVFSVTFPSVSPRLLRSRQQSPARPFVHSDGQVTACEVLGYVGSGLKRWDINKQ